MLPTIHFALVDDWELSGDGSGDPRYLQFAPMRELVRIYNAHGVHGSFNAEVMQQITFRKFQQQHPDLKELADEWDDQVRQTFRAGHDIQLHIHPQWSRAEYDNGRWSLKGDWSILNYSIDDARQMIAAGKDYLENLLRPVNPDYRCVSFRSGSWCIAPSPHMLGLLAGFGIVFDMSIVGGVRYQTRRIDLDYRHCEEDFLPFYPVMTDARKVSSRKERIVCIPTNHFHGSRRQTLQHHASKATGALKSRLHSQSKGQESARSVEAYGHEWAQSGASPLAKLYTKGLRPYLRGRHLISDLAQLDYGLMQEMLASIRRRARAAKAEAVPVILENHTKDIRDFIHIERFVADVARAPDIKCVTLSDIAEGIQAGRFQIKTSAPR